MEYSTATTPHTTYFPGISTADDTWTKEELEAIGQKSKEEARQQYAERQEKKFGRLAEYSLDTENQKRYAARREAWKSRNAELLIVEESVIDKQKTDLKTEIQMLHDKKAGLQEQMRDLENEEKLLTQKVYFDLSGTDEEVERLRTVSENKKSLSKRTKELQEQILEKQEVYKSEAEARILKDAIVKEIKLSKKMNPVSVDMVESTLRNLKEKYGIMPEGVIFSPVRVPDGTALYNWLDDKLYLSNRFADVDGYLDVVKQSESSLAEYRKHYRIEETAKERMENADKILADRSVKGYERSKAILEKADAEIDLNIFRQGVRENLSDAIVHEYGHFIQRHANVDYVQKKNVFGMKDLGGKLVGGDWEYEINTAYSRAGKVEASKISKYATKNPYETFAEGFLAMHKGEKIPDGIEKVISEAMQKSNAKPIAKTTGSGIINLKSANEESSVTEIRNLGKINIEVLEKEFGKIQTDEIIVTNERIDHIKERHPEDYDLFEKYGEESVSSPDLIIKDIKHQGTVFMVKKLPETNLNVVVRVVLETDDSKLKNSVMTFYRIREKNLKKLIEKNGMLYKKE